MLAIIALAIAIYFLWTNVKRKNKDQPPGPWGFPILGHLPFLGKNPAIRCLEWKQIYGPIISLRFGAVPVVVINDAKIIKEALNLNSFSGRPLLKNYAEICDSKGIVFADGPSQTEQRQFALKYFREFGVYNAALEFRILEEINHFVDNLRKKCTASSVKKAITINRIFQFPVINSFWMTIMGERFEDGDPRVLHISKLLKIMLDTNESIVAQLSWFFNWWASLLCFFGVNRTVNASKEWLNYMAEQVEERRSDYVQGQPKHFTHAYFDRVAETVDENSSFCQSRQEQKHVTLDLFGATIDTTSTTLDWLLLYMAMEPEVQRKLQTEIDTVIGNKSGPNDAIPAPSIIHRTQMPYTEAVLQELLRISSVIPFTMYHRTREDVNLHGYIIPKDTMIIPNLYGVHHDPDTWPEPDRFNPERFLDDEGKLKKIPGDPLIPFGYGKRSCIGEKLARDQLFLFTTSFFQNFTVSCTKELPSVEGTFGLVYFPKTFDLFIAERLPSPA